MYASQNIMLGSGPQLAGGFESMSNIPHYLPAMRTGMKLGPSQVIDGIINDGLWDVYNNQHMGMCGEKCAEDYGITRKDQDAYAVESYRRANAAIEAGKFKDEVSHISLLFRRPLPPLHLTHARCARRSHRSPTSPLSPAAATPSSTKTPSQQTSTSTRWAAFVPRLRRKMEL